MRKIRIALLFGGRSAEHEVSLHSAASVMQNLDPERFDPILIGIDKQGRWWVDSQQQLISENSLALPHDTQVILNSQIHHQDQPISGQLLPLSQTNLSGVSTMIDVAFPVLHGPMGEDGTVQGLLELADLPYVSCGVMSSAIAMDKDVSKRLVQQANIPVVPYVVLKQGYWEKDEPSCLDKILNTLTFPLFVKPANLGSSVGVAKVNSTDDLSEAIKSAFQYDTKVLVEKAVNAREIEIAVLENSDYGEKPMASIPGEIISQHEFYSYTAKYLDENGATLKIPADLTPEQKKQAQAMAIAAFEALECEGMARIDLFLDHETELFCFNEANTIPGFTKISMYPKLWEASGINYTELLSHLIDLALARQSRKRKNKLQGSEFKKS